MSRTRSASRSGSSADPSRYYITLEPDGSSIKIHRPSGNIILREGDTVSGVLYINSTRRLPFRFKRVSFDRDRVITKLTFKFIREGKSASPKFIVGDGRVIEFENLRGGIAVPSDQFTLVAKYIQKIV